MKNVVFLSGFLVFLYGVSGKSQKVSVLEGDSLTLHTNLTETHKIDLMMWMYGAQSAIIAKLNGKSQTSSFYDVDDGRFEDRLQLDNQTGSLSIRDIRTKHSGDYQLKIISSETSYKTFSVTVHDVFFAGITNTKEGESVTLHTGVNEIQKYDVILWMFGPLSPDSFIAKINITTHKMSYSDDGRFRLDDQTGSLTITNTRSTDTGVYQLQITSTKETFYKRFNVFVLDTLRFSEGENITLDTGVNELQRDDQVLWRFGSEDTIIAKRDGDTNQLSFNDVDDGRFGDRLDMDDQTGSLKITNTKSTDSGVYHLQISSRNTVLYKKFRVTVWLDTLKVTAGEPVILNTDIPELVEDSKILWTHGDNDTCIAEINRATSKSSVYRGNDLRFRDRLQLDHQTGSLTIWNISIAHSDVYKLQISSRIGNRHKRFMIIVDENKVPVMEGDPAKLNTDIHELQRDSLILWMFGPEDNLIAKADMENNKMSTYDGVDGRFRDRLVLDHQTGSLTITNITNTDCGLYKLKIISSRETKYKRFKVTVRGNRRREIKREDAEGSHQRENSEGIPLILMNSSSSV